MNMRAGNCIGPLNCSVRYKVINPIPPNHIPNDFFFAIESLGDDPIR